MGKTPHRRLRFRPILCSMEIYSAAEPLTS